MSELVEAEVPAVAPLVIREQTLHRYEGFRFAVFERRGGRAPELSDRTVLERIGRFLGRLHAVGARAAYRISPALDVEAFGVEPSTYLLDAGWIGRTWPRCTGRRARCDRGGAARLRAGRPDPAPAPSR